MLIWTVCTFTERLPAFFLPFTTKAFNISALFDCQIALLLQSVTMLIFTRQRQIRLRSAVAVSFVHAGVKLDYAHHCGAEAQHVPPNIILVKVIVFVAFLCFPSNKTSCWKVEPMTDVLIVIWK